MLDLWNAEESVPSTLTHKMLVESAYKWALKSGKCGFAFKELVTYSPETADVIGFGSSMHSVLIECKASRSDFHADKKKAFRQDPTKGMGLFRYYCCPRGLIKPKDLPAKWGLIWVSENGKANALIHPIQRRYREDKHSWMFFERAIDHEVYVMYSALRRLHLRGHIPTIYDSPFKS